MQQIYPPLRPPRFVVYFVAFCAQEPAVDAAQEPAVDAAQEPAVDAAQEPVVDAAQEPAVDAAQEPAVDAAQEPAVNLQQQVCIFEISKRRCLAEVRARLTTILRSLPEEYLFKALVRRADGSCGTIVFTSHSSSLVAGGGGGGTTTSSWTKVLAGARMVPNLMDWAQVSAAERVRFLNGEESCGDGPIFLTEGGGESDVVLSSGAGIGIGAGSLETLTDEQQNALSSSAAGGPVFISGRSGSGKTTVLLRCALQVVGTHHGLEDGGSRREDVSGTLVVTQSSLLAKALKTKFERLSGRRAAAETVSSAPLSENVCRGSSGGRPTGHAVMFVSYNELLLQLDNFCCSIDGRPFYAETRRASLGKTEKSLGDRLLQARMRRISGSPHIAPDGVEARAEVGFAEFSARYWPAVVASVNAELRRRTNNPKRAAGVILSAQEGYRHVMAQKQKVDHLFDERGGGVQLFGGREQGGAGRGRDQGGGGSTGGGGEQRGDNLLSEAETAFVRCATEKYNQLLRKNAAFDVLDVVANLAHRRTQHQRVFGPALSCARFANVLIDEAQDLFLMQVNMLKFLNQPEGEEQKLQDHGMVSPAAGGARSSSTRGKQSSIVFCADAAQSIMMGRRFQLGRLKDLFWCDSPSSLRVHQLTVNFRSHTGILNVANALVDVLCAFFGAEMDRLPRERSANEPDVASDPSRSPHLVTGFSGRDFGERLSAVGGAEVCSLGADQVIVVRDDAAREEAQRVFAEASANPPPCQNGECSHSVVGEPVILTVLEAKGMEFEDVVLFNFFNTAPQAVARQYTFLYAYMRRAIGNLQQRCVGAKDGNLQQRLVQFRAECTAFDDILADLDALEKKTLRGRHTIIQQASTARLLTLVTESQEPRVIHSTEDMVHQRSCLCVSA